MTQTAPSPDQVVAQRYRAPAPAAPAEWNPVLRVLHEHRSIRRYLPDPLPDGVLELLISAAQSAPTSSNLQVWSVVAVRDPQRKARLAALAGDQEQIRQAPLLLVWTADLARLRGLAAERGAPLDGADYLESSYVAFLDAALAAQNALVRLVVGRPDPAENARVKPRLPQAAVLHEETYTPAGLADIDDYEQRIAQFYAEQDLAHSWIDRVLARLGTAEALEGRDRLRESLAAQGFPLH
ncbi:nitroreductase family protein [Nocardia sp. NPDC004568]|uniref:nitroreductase family protein n=1 Tax=Nocardia sp. NPDC004568 TaxID=3154551 RepID=UPI00339EFDB9